MKRTGVGGPVRTFSGGPAACRFGCCEHIDHDAKLDVIGAAGSTPRGLTPGRHRSTRRREYLACGWLPPKWDWVDPAKDARAEIEQIRAGLKSRSQSIAERGYDIEEVDAAIAADRAREARLGLSFDSTVPADQPTMEGANA